MLKTLLCALTISSSVLLAADAKVVSMMDLSHKELFAFAKKKSPKIILNIPHDTSLPIELFNQSDLIGLSASGKIPLCLNFKQDLYVKKEKNKILFSQDLENWKSFGEMTQSKVAFSFNPQENSLLKVNTALELKN